MPTLLYRGSGLVKGIGFDSWRGVGAVMQAVRVYNMRQVDELVFLDVEATNLGREPDYDLVDEIADECFMPLTVGGGIRSAEHAVRLLRVGADKVAIGTAAHEVDGLITEVSRRFGSQCVIAAVDVRRCEAGWDVTTRSGTRRLARDPVDVCSWLQEQGAGEILLTSVERDGEMSGYELELYRQVCAAVTIPVIASGGAGSANDIVEVIAEAGASAAAAGSLFHFTEVTPLEVKAAMAAAGLPVRR